MRGPDVVKAVFLLSSAITACRPAVVPVTATRFPTETPAPTLSPTPTKLPTRERIMSYVSSLREGACDNGRVTITVGVPSGKRIEIAPQTILLSDSARKGFLTGSQVITDTAIIDGVEVKVLGIANNVVEGELSVACVR